MQVMNTLDEVEKAILVFRGQRVILDVTLADWFGVSLKELHIVIQKNNKLMDPAFVFSLDKDEKALLKRSSNHATARGLVRSTFAFTIHGIILLTACLGNSGSENQNARMIRILTVLNTGFSAG